MILAVSCIKFLRGGPIKILEEFIYEIDQRASESHYTNIIVFVNHGVPPISYSSTKIKFIKVSKFYTLNHFTRFFWEFIASNYLVRKYSIDRWFSLHDVSTAPFSGIKRAVYVHSPMMFIRPKIDWLIHSRQEFIFSLIYPLLMRYFVASDDLVIVQQKWFAEQLKRKYLGKNAFIISHPRTVFTSDKSLDAVTGEEIRDTFFYPSLVRSFKSHDFLLKIAIENPELTFLITSSGDGGTRLERRLFKKFGHLNNVRWLGYLSQDEMTKAYKQAEYVIFPSEIETWGLPLTEARIFNKRIIVFEGCHYFNGPLNGYDKTYVFERSALRFRENLKDKDNFRVSLAKEVTGPSWFELIKNL